MAGCLFLKQTPCRISGDHCSYWCLSHNDEFYGPRISCNVFVDPKEMLEPKSNKAGVLNVAEQSEVM